MAYWLLKSEPTDYSITDLERDRTTLWDGVRNYQARNFLREMKIGDYAFIYHSNAKPPGIVGLAKVIRENVVDPTQFDPQDKHYDPKATSEHPRWQTVEIEFIQHFHRLISITDLKQQFSPEELLVVKRGNRLSVMPIIDGVAQRILASI
ncbi:EVE domain-containing protein [Roseofilum sp. BLCC_M154]|uniref:EVE domain-containing protein n=1 Tax=Roseofilum acuticapitatum BLCC-M154 TaxID=3022444 RepID=A0ABT7ANE3_9CYAN|nr:EVE domain-containing protein [Roseofilum acuticapitatum]MDJ1167974.1 EVE domain-containing protein [Roseofilum acuticapitatum BLCC-M154]